MTPVKAVSFPRGLVLASILVLFAAGCLAQGLGAPTVISSSLPTVPQAGAPNTWRVVALGDSVTSGANCSCAAFPEVYAKDLASARGVGATAVNLGVGGWTSSDLLGAISDPASPTSVQVSRSDIVLITIGANDFTDRHDPVVAGECLGKRDVDCFGAEATEMRINVERILRQVHEERRGKPTAVFVTGYWNVFEDGDVARQAFPTAGLEGTQELTALANSYLQKAAVAGKATYVDLLAAFNGVAAAGNITTLLASDGDHPNEAGHQLIAKRLLAAGLPGLTTG